MAEIMGRPEPEEAPPPAEIAPEEAPPPEEAEPEIAPPVLEAEPEIPPEMPPEELPPPEAAEIPGWLQELAPPEAAEPEIAPPTLEAEPEIPPEAAPPVEEAPPVEAVPSIAPEEVFAPAIEETPVPTQPEKIAAPPVEEIVAHPDVFGWTAFGAPEVVPVEEKLPPVEEVEPEVMPPEEITATPEAEEAEPTPEVPEGEALEALLESIAAQQAYLKEHPRDYEAQLSLAQTLWQAGKWEKALEKYTSLIRSSKVIEDVIPDLEKCLEQRPQVNIRQALGDAYMKDGQLQKALDTYRRALETL